jgi:hypothetical protein
MSYRGPDYVSPLTIQGRAGGKGGANWLDYQTKIQEGSSFDHMQDHPFVIETTAGEDAE